MDLVLDWLTDLRYLAMFGILFLCGVGLPVPEEVTLVGSGLLVGWGDANFWLASVTCVAGILAGDAIIFGMGHHFGQKFLQSRPMRLLLTHRRQLKVAKFFVKHGSKAVFFARFFAGVRIGVYAYAGSQRMSWPKFLLLDLLGALISGPTSIFIGKIVALKVASDKDEAAEKALRLVREFGHWLLAAAILLIAAYIVFLIVRRKREAARPAAKAARTPPAGAAASGPSRKSEGDRV